jgi:hypothetical protein
VSPALIDELRKRDDVVDVRLQSDSYIIQTDTRDEVYPLAAYIRQRNATPLAVANVALPQIVYVDTAAGRVNATAAGVVRVVAEPLLDTDSVVTVKMIAVVNEGTLIDYYSPEISQQTVQGRFDATVVRLDHKEYSYFIPWQSRNSLGNLSRFGTVKYDKVDAIVFTTPLNTTQVIGKKTFTYIVYIDQGSAQVDSDFDNVSQVSLNFQDVQFELPPSKLLISTNQTPDIPFNATVMYSYAIALGNTTPYDFGNQSLVVETGREYGLNDSIQVDVSALALGNKIISVRSVSIPS